MSGVIVTIAIDGSQSRQPFAGAEPDLKVLQSLVGGYIETLPDGVVFAGRPRHAYVDEDGRAKQLPRNEIGSRLWLATLGRGPFWYQPEVFGPLVILLDDAVSPVVDPLAEARAKFDEAVQALGPLTVGQVTDLLADNFELPLAECRRQAKELIEERARERDTEMALCDEFEKYLADQNIAPASADEIILRDDLTAAQRGWISTFILRWDAVMGTPS